MKRIGILTAGGDCPGLNAVIRVVAKSAQQGGMEVVGIEDGYLGLCEGRMRVLRPEDVSGIITHGGTILGACNKTNPAAHRVRQPDGTIVVRDLRDEIVARCRDAGIEAMVVIGGDGTMCGAAALAERGLPIVGVPKTIDNDLWSTEVTFGYDTAVATACDALDKVHTTAGSHHRILVVELMGRYAGWLALGAGVASGSDVILIPEIPFRMDAVVAKCVDRGRHGKRYTVIAAGEGAAPLGGSVFVDRVDESSAEPIRLGGIGKWVADQVEQASGLEARSIVLGHVQRGGTPTANDRMLATCFGHHAFELLVAGRLNRVVVQQQGRIDSSPLSEVAGRIRTVPPDHPLVRAARGVGTCMGD
ncbi:MAG TPA: ATP-dependent 6-phosphofructokinase [Myxococcota bacterium]|jgi:6-phosphofructokinase 1|nr:ATP-dependent 6-phosphofructokinase [Myxococcota bacterium]